MSLLSPNLFQMAIVCKSCEKCLYKADGSGPYCCPSCVGRNVAAIDSETGELVEIKLNKGQQPVTPKSASAVHRQLIKESRFGVFLPHREEPIKMLRLKSKQFRSTTIPFGSLYVRFNESGIAEVEAHHKQFLDPVFAASPGRFEWLESSAEHLVETLVALKSQPEVVAPPAVPEKVVEVVAIAEEAKTALSHFKKAKKKNKKVEE